MTTNLQLAIERVYKTFATYTLRSTIDGCPCCVSGADQDVIHRKPLRELTHDDLARYTFKAMTTWGDTLDFKHFLPRMLELMAMSGYGSNAWLLFGKLSYGSWRQWPKAEVICIEYFLLSWWTEYVSVNSYFDTTLLVELYKTVGDMEILLKVWPISFADYSFRNLISFITTETAALIQRKSHYKNIDLAAVLALQKWLVAQVEIVEEGFYLNEKNNPDWATQIAAAYDQLAIIKQYPL